MYAMDAKATRHLHRGRLKLRAVSRFQVFHPKPFRKGPSSHGLSEARGSESIKRNLERSLGLAEVVAILKVCGVQAVAKEDVEDLTCQPPPGTLRQNREESLRLPVQDGRKPRGLNSKSAETDAPKMISGCVLGSSRTTSNCRRAHCGPGGPTLHCFKELPIRHLRR